MTTKITLLQNAILNAVSYGDGLDKQSIKRVQKRISANSKRVLKLLRAQALLAEYLFLKYEEAGTAIMLMASCYTEKKLYQQMSRLGFVWMDYNNLWRLDKRLKQPRGLEDYAD